jgi:FkbM family methyltransferase
MSAFAAEQSGDAATQTTARGRFALRALASLRFLPPLSWVFGASTLLTHKGLTFRVYPARNHQDRALYITGEYDERRSMAQLARLVRGRRARILDIGANVGIYTVFLASEAGDGSRVIAFEPNPTIADRLRENVRLNGLGGRVVIEETALGETEGEACLSVPLTNFGGASLHPKWLRGGSRTVRQRPLADWLGSRDGVELVVVKIDVEGYEDRVLVPALEALEVGEWPDALLLEVSSHAMWQRDPMEHLRQAGYREVFSAERNKLFVRPGLEAST